MRLGQKHLPECIEKMKKAKIGNTWNKGKVRTFEMRVKISQNHVGMKGRKHSEETKAKMRIAQLGPKGNNWKGGITVLRTEIRNLSEYKRWKLGVFYRDNKKCQDCGYMGRKIEADHIISFADILNTNNINNVKEALLCNLLWDINNGITRCSDCHVKRHKNDVPKGKMK